MGDEVSTSSVHTFSFHVDVVFPLSSPPSRFVFLQRIETNVEEVSTQFIHLAHPPFSYIAQVCAMATLREPLMRFKPGIPYEIRYGLIEGDVLFLIMYWW